MITTNSPHPTGKLRSLARVLIVDDQAEGTSALEVALEGLRVETACARSGEEALGYLLKGDFAVMLLDVRMPGMDGFETAQAIRGRARTSTLPIIFVTGFDPRSDVMGRAYALGAVDFITKPVDPGALRAKVGVFVDLHNAAREVEQARARFESLAELSPVGVFRTDGSGECLYVNPRWCEIAGISSLDAAGNGWTKALHPEDRERVFKEWTAAAREGIPFRSEYRFTHASGRVTWVLGQAKEERAGGRVLGYVGTITDITERKEAEEELRRGRAELERRVEERTRDLAAELAERRNAERALISAQEQLRLVTDTAPALISYLGSDGRYLYTNREYEEWFGESAQNVKGKHLREVLGEAAFERIRPYVERALKGERVEYEAEVPYRAGGSRYVHARYAPHVSASGDVLGFVALVTDITAHKRGEVALRESERGERARAQELQALMESVPAVVWLAQDPECRRITGNRASYEVLRMSRGTNLSKSAPPGEAPTHFRTLQDGRELSTEDLPLQRAARGEEVRDCTFDLTFDDGRIVTLFGSAIPLRNPDGTPRGALSAFVDITRRSRAEEEVRQLARDLERKVEARTADLHEALRELEAFAYTVAHDLRAPIRAMTGFSQVVLDDYGDRLDETGRVFLQRILEGGKRMDVMIRDLLDYSRVARAEVTLEKVDLGSAVQESITDLAPVLEERKAEVEVVEPLPGVMAHPLTLQLALGNLLSNAAKFVSPGTLPRIHIRAEAKGDQVRLWVEDNGIGIAPEHHERVFGVFERLHSKDAYPGTGIGLAVVRKAMERMGGGAGVESRLGHGSRFFLDFPVVK